MEEKEKKLENKQSASKQLAEKQPVVVLVGHIDHGKSSILEKIRDFKITEKEIGGITQHIGAYEIEEKGKKITFIDTPGHEAFMAMRARGAQVADIAILVIAADEGIQPQTEEAISHIKKSGALIIVALNKIDKATAQPEKIKEELAKYDILIEEKGGKIPCLEVSAKTGKGIADLLDLILLVSEMENFQADIGSRAEGVVIESRMDQKRGPLASLLVEAGILKEGEIVATNTSFGKIKRMENFLGKQIKQAYPGQPVLVLGFANVVGVGERFKVFDSLDEAKEESGNKQERFVWGPESIEPGQKLVNIILKSDVLGSIEPIENVLKNLSCEVGKAGNSAALKKPALKVLKAEAGDINLSDIKLAETAENPLILGFRVKVSPKIAEAAKRKNIAILNFDLIYDLVEGVREFMAKILARELVRLDLAELKTLAVFRTEKKRQIIGAKVLSGEIKKGVKLEVFREEEKIGTGKVISLEKNKKEIEKGIKGEEVGILFEGSVRIQEGDILKAYERKQQKVVLA